MLQPNHTHRTHVLFYAGTLIGALPQCAIRKLYRSSRSTSHRSSFECSPFPDSNRTAHLVKGIETGLLLEDKKPLKRTPHFFEPGVGECVNATGLLVPLTCSTTQSLIGHRFLRPNCIHSSTAAY